jgi:hypothetical protein
VKASRPPAEAPTPTMMYVGRFPARRTSLGRPGVLFPKYASRVASPSTSCAFLSAKPSAMPQPARRRSRVSHATGLSAPGGLPPATVFRDTASCARPSVPIHRRPMHRSLRCPRLPHSVLGAGSGDGQWGETSEPGILDGRLADFWELRPERRRSSTRAPCLPSTRGGTGRPPGSPSMVPRRTRRESGSLTMRLYIGEPQRAQKARSLPATTRIP